jgi:hypothetical protein
MSNPTSPRREAAVGLGAVSCAVCARPMSFPCIVRTGVWVHSGCATSRPTAAR